ncbi:hypothetical protein [Streptomyces cinereoruber]
MRLTSRLVAVVSAVVLTTGGAVLAAAPMAVAASIPSACQYQWSTPHNARTIVSVNLRTGPGTGYASVGILVKETAFTH